MARACQLPEGWRIRSYRCGVAQTIKRVFFDPEGRHFPTYAKLKEALGGELPPLFQHAHNKTSKRKREQAEHSSADSPAGKSFAREENGESNPVELAGNLQFPGGSSFERAPVAVHPSAPSRRSPVAFDESAELAVARECQLPEGWRVRSYRSGPQNTLKRVFCDPNGRCYDNYGKLREALGGELTPVLANMGRTRAAFRNQSEVYEAELQAAADVGLPEGWRVKFYSNGAQKRRVFYMPSGHLLGTLVKLRDALGGTLPPALDSTATSWAARGAKAARRGKAAGAFQADKGAEAECTVVLSADDALAACPVTHPAASSSSAVSPLDAAASMPPLVVLNPADPVWEAGWERKIGLLPYNGPRAAWIPPGWREACKPQGDKKRKCYVSPMRKVLWDKDGVFRQHIAEKGSNTTGSANCVTSDATSSTGISSTGVKRQRAKAKSVSRKVARNGVGALEVARNGAGAPVAPPQVADEWIQIMHAEYNIPYWWNRRTRESVWQKPAEAR